jgi:hypothetical protein
MRPSKIKVKYVDNDNFKGNFYIRRQIWKNQVAKVF